MAGDWLKFEKATPDKPEVFAIAAALGLDPDAVVGKLIRVWSWFDTHTTDGNGRGVTLALLDRVSGVSGFAAAMQTVSWLACDEQGVSLPKFDRHTGETSKGRALTAKRVAKHKDGGNAKGNGDSVSSSVTSALPREEKRREEKEQKQSAPSGADLLAAAGIEVAVARDYLAIRKAKRLPLTETALAGLRKEAERAGLTLQAALAKCCERGWAGFDADWLREGKCLNPSPTNTLPGGGRQRLG